MLTSSIYLADPALGWQVACARYRHKICLLLERMDALRASDNMRYSNQPSAFLYMNEAGRRIDQMILSFQNDFEDSEVAVLPHFQHYVDAEESRIRLALERVDYDVSDFDTLTLVLGDQPYLERVRALAWYLFSIGIYSPSGIDPLSVVIPTTRQASCPIQRGHKSSPSSQRTPRRTICGVSDP